jgi:hypothetical protein
MNQVLIFPVLKCHFQVDFSKFRFFFFFFFFLETRPAAGTEELIMSSISHPLARESPDLQ